MGANNLASLAEMIAEERGHTVPTRDLYGHMSIASRALLNGEGVRPDEFSDAHGCHRSLLGQAATQLSELGFVVERVPEVVPGPDGRNRQMKRLRVANLDHEPTEADYQRAIDAVRARKASLGGGRGHKVVSNALAERPAATASASGASSPVASPGDHEALPALPGLGQTITVTAQVLNDDGTITLALRNGVRRWLTTVTGVVEQ